MCDKCFKEYVVPEDPPPPHGLRKVVRTLDVQLFICEHLFFLSIVLVYLAKITTDIAE